MGHVNPYGIVRIRWNVSSLHQKFVSLLDSHPYNVRHKSLAVIVLENYRNTSFTATLYNYEGKGLPYATKDFFTPCVSHLFVTRYPVLLLWGFVHGGIQYPSWLDTSLTHQQNSNFRILLNLKKSDSCNTSIGHTKDVTRPLLQTYDMVQ